MFFIILMVLAILPSDIQQQNLTPAIKSSVYGGTLVWGTINPPTIINPVLTTHSVSTALLGLLFDSLVRIGPHGEIAPGLATSWEVSEDGLIYTFHLRPHVYFHDGKECTAEDVKFTYDAIRNPINKSPGRGGIEPIKEWKVIDPYTIQVILKYTVSNFLTSISREILPKHLYQGSSILNNPHNYAPVGTGPFKLESWDRKANEIVLKANENYFEGRPGLDKILIKTYKNNSDLWAALMRGEVDFAKYLNQQDYEVIRKDNSFKTYQTNSGSNFAILYNTHDSILFDRDVRLALKYAIDRKALMRAVDMGGIESNGPFFPQSIGFNKQVEAPSYNPVRAKMLLAGRGWVLGEEGLLRKGGRPLVLTMIVNRNRPNYSQMALVLRQQLSEIGIGLKIISYEDEGQLTTEYLEKVKPQMWLRLFVSGMTDNPSDMARSWYSSSSKLPSQWFYQNPDIDRLFEKGLSLKDEHERAQLYQEIHSLIDRDQSACFLFYSVVYHAINKKIQNVDSFFTDYMPGEYIKYWFINLGKEVKTWKFSTTAPTM